MQPYPLLASVQATGHSANAPGVLDFFLQSGPMAKVVLGILILCSLASWAVILNKFFLLRKSDRQSKEFLKVFHRSNRFSEVNSATERLSTSPLVGIFQAGYAEIDTQIKAAGETEKTGSRYLIQSVQAVERSLQRSMRAELASLSRGTQILATTAAAAPFIGLFGTVWGIMIAFGEIGATGSTSITTVAPGIAEALVNTAAGLGAAIPALIGYNYYAQRLRESKLQMEDFGLEFVNLTERNFT
ncbi:MAG: MotA/TolQ/ExbB proton channel family protein [Deltaproteobacteria bacterium]|nr:MotA/TolQ/ExbB proton channel family protein [Deltaproteobacteria bacterium]